MKIRGCICHVLFKGCGLPFCMNHAYLKITPRKQLEHYSCKDCQEALEEVDTKCNWIMFSYLFAFTTIGLFLGLFLSRHIDTTSIEVCSGIACEDYRGFQSRTVSGKTCQHWDSDTPHERSVCCTPETKPDKGLEENYCRNPSAEHGLSPTIWCYTTDPAKRWENCIPTAGV